MFTVHVYKADLKDSFLYPIIFVRKGIQMEIATKKIGITGAETILFQGRLPRQEPDAVYIGDRNSAQSFARKLVIKRKSWKLKGAFLWEKALSYRKYTVSRKKSNSFRILEPFI